MYNYCRDGGRWCSKETVSKLSASLEVTMEIKYQDVILRDFRESDIEDEIRWMNIDTAWMKADTPWEEFEPSDPDELRQIWMDNIQNMPPDALRWRLEIEVDGKHIGFVSAYFVDENFEWISFMDVKEDTKVHRALGIEICEPDYWCRGIGAKALSAFMQYHSEHGGSDYVLETWSGNHRMVKCAEKLGFTVCKRDVGIREVNGEKYDAITMILRKA